MRLVIFLALALMGASAAHAEGCQSTQNVVQHIFDAADEDKDGTLTRSEYEKAGLQEFGVTFEESDTNSDGATSMSEYLELYERHHPPVDRSEA